MKKSLKIPRTTKKTKTKPMPKKKVAKKTAKKTTVAGKGINLVAFILDETGSMMILRQETLDGFDKYVNTVKADSASQYLFRLTRFNSVMGVKVTPVQPLNQVGSLNDVGYSPNGTTPLYDAIGTTIREVEKINHKGNILVVILTDGQENASKDFTRQGILHLIEGKQKDGWNFMYLGCNQDAWREAGAIGINAGSTMSYDPRDTHGTYVVAATATIRNSRATMGQSVNCNTLDDSPEWEKARKKDGYDSGVKK